MTKGPEFDPKNWGAPENPSKFSGWNAALSPIFAMAAIVGALSYFEPQAAKGIINTMTFGYAFPETGSSKPPAP